MHFEANIISWKYKFGMCIENSIPLPLLHNAYKENMQWAPSHIKSQLQEDQAKIKYTTFNYWENKISKSVLLTDKGIARSTFSIRFTAYKKQK